MGIGARAASVSRSERTRMVAPSFTAWAASSQISSRRASIPSGPAEAGQVVAIQWEKNRGSPERTMDSNSASERIGLESSMRCACCGVSSSSGPRRPSWIRSDITSFSRIGSMGGLVTWANCSWKYWVSRRGRLERTASPVSSPMDPRGFSPRAMSAMTSRRSSTVYPNTRLKAAASKRSSASGSKGAWMRRVSVFTQSP